MAKRSNRWQQLCDSVVSDDGLVTFKAGSWTGDKLYWWCRYVEITTTAMVGKPFWPDGVVYVDLFAGPGISTERDSGTRFPGSPLIAVNAPKPFSRILLCEEDSASADACRARLTHFAPLAPWKVFQGDCNLQIDAMIAEIPPAALVLAFIDPTGLHVSFDTIRKLVNGRSVDLLILFADSMDIVRNVEMYAQQRDSNLDRMLGPTCDWRAEWRALSNHTPANVSRLFLDILQRQLRDRLRYQVFDSVPMKNSLGTTIYRLMYASRHERGLDFWKKSTETFRRGEMNLFD